MQGGGENFLKKVSLLPPAPPTSFKNFQKKFLSAFLQQPHILKNSEKNIPAPLYPHLFQKLLIKMQLRLLNCVDRLFSLVYLTTSINY